MKRNKQTSGGALVVLALLIVAGVMGFAILFFASGVDRQERERDALVMEARAALRDLKK